MAIYVPIVMYCLRLFIVVLQELHCLQTCNFPIPWSLWISICTQSFISQLPLVIEICLSKLKKDNNNNNNKEKMKNCENELLQFYFPVVQFRSFLRTPIF